MPPGPPGSPELREFLCHCAPQLVMAEHSQQACDLYIRRVFDRFGGACVTVKPKNGSSSAKSPDADAVFVVELKVKVRE
jgi:hypothetical protein